MQADKKLLSDVSEWIVSDFIQARFYNNYTSIGEGSPEELKAAFELLMAQYIDMRGDSYTEEYITLKVQISRIEFIWALVEKIGQIMITSYDESCAQAMRELYADLGYEFSPTSFIEDFEKVGRAELTSKFDHEQLNKRLAELEGGVETEADPMKLYDRFLDLFVQLEKHLGFKLNKKELTVAELAKYEKDYSNECKRLSQQIQINKSHG